MSGDESGPRSSLLAFGVLLLLAGGALVPYFPVIAAISAGAGAMCGGFAWFKSEGLVWKSVSSGLFAGALVLAYFAVVSAMSPPG